MVPEAPPPSLWTPLPTPEPGLLLSGSRAALRALSGPGGAGRWWPQATCCRGCSGPGPPQTSSPEAGDQGASPRGVNPLEMGEAAAGRHGAVRCTLAWSGSQPPAGPYLPPAFPAGPLARGPRGCVPVCRPALAPGPLGGRGQVNRIPAALPDLVYLRKNARAFFPFPARESPLSNAPARPLPARTPRSPRGTAAPGLLTQ